MAKLDTARSGKLMTIIQTVGLPKSGGGGNASMLFSVVTPSVVVVVA